jgi:hypothetical protein
MINRKGAGVALVVLTAATSAACAAPGSNPPFSGRPSSTPTSVAPGCDLSGTRVHWAKPTRQPRLTRVTLFRIVPGDPDSHTGDEVFAEPFTPSIAQVAAPDDWTARLAESLSAETGDTVRTGPARVPDSNFALLGNRDDDSIPETLLYEGVEVVSAGFSVDCDGTVSGIFTSWIATSVGGVTCGQFEEPAEPVGRLARRYCPRTPAPRQSSIDAAPFDTVPPLVLPGE